MWVPPQIYVFVNYSRRPHPLRPDYNQTRRLDSSTGLADGNRVQIREFGRVLADTNISLTLEPHRPPH